MLSRFTNIVAPCTWITFCVCPQLLFALSRKGEKCGFRECRAHNSNPYTLCVNLVSDFSCLCCVQQWEVDAERAPE